MFPQVHGFDTITVAQVMNALMLRLGYTKYFVQVHAVSNIPWCLRTGLFMP